MSDQKSKFVDEMIQLRREVTDKFCDLRAYTSHLAKVRAFVCEYLNTCRDDSGVIKQYWVKCDRDGMNIDFDAKSIKFIVTATLSNDEEPQGVEFIIMESKTLSDWCDRCDNGQNVDDTYAAYDRAMGCV